MTDIIDVVRRNDGTDVVLTGNGLHVVRPDTGRPQPVGVSRLPDVPEMIALGRIRHDFWFPYAVEHSEDRQLWFIFERPGGGPEDPIVTAFDDSLQPVAYRTDPSAPPVKNRSRPLYSDTARRPSDYLRPVPVRGARYIPVSVDGTAVVAWDTSTGTATRIVPDCPFHSTRTVVSRPGETVNVTLGGLLDGSNTECAGFKNTYAHASCPAFQPIERIEIKNIGSSAVDTPRIRRENGMDWVSTQAVIQRIVAPDMTQQERVMAIWAWMRRNVPFGTAQHTFYPPRESVCKFLNNSGAGSCGTHFYLTRLLRAAGVETESGGCPFHGFHHVLCRTFFDGSSHYVDMTHGPSDGEHAYRSGVTGYRGSMALRLDNKTIASAHDMVEDPYLAYRLGAHPNQWDKLHFKARGQTAPSRWSGNRSASYTDPETMSYSLRPGERIIFRRRFYGKHVGTFRPTDLIVNGEMVYRPGDDPEWSARSRRNGNGSEVVIRVHCPYAIVGGAVRLPPIRERLEVAVSFDGTRRQVIRSADEPPSGSRYLSFDHLPELGQRERHGILEDIANTQYYGPPCYEYLISLRLPSVDGPDGRAHGSEGSVVAEIARHVEVITEFQMNERTLPSLRVGSNRLVVEQEVAPGAASGAASGAPTGGAIEITLCRRESSAASPLPAPTAPVFPAQNGTAVGAGFSFSWEPGSGNEEIIDHQICVSERPDMAWPLATCLDRFTGDGNSQAPNYGPTWFVPGRRYYWRVRALSADGVFSPWSDTWSFDYDGPGHVDRLRVDGVSDVAGVGPNGTRVLTWSAPTRGTMPDHYRVYASNERGFIPTDTPFEIFNGDRTVQYPATYLTEVSQTRMELPQSSGHFGGRLKLYYRVVAVDGSGNGGTPSECASVPEPVIVVERVLRFTEEVAELHPVRCIVTEPEIQYSGPVVEVMKHQTNRAELRLKGAPQWLTIAEDRSAVAGTPPRGSAGTYSILIEATSRRTADDKEIGRTTTAVEIQVNAHG